MRIRATQPIQDVSSQARPLVPTVMGQETPWSWIQSQPPPGLVAGHRSSSPRFERFLVAFPGREVTIVSDPGLHSSL